MSAQANDVPEDVIMRALRTEPGKWFTHWDVESPLHGTWSIVRMEPSLRAFPPKVLLAKLRSMERRGLIEGCGCGCRGDWHVRRHDVMP